LGVVLFDSRKELPPVKTCPVGPPGTLTTSAFGVPFAPYRVEVFVAWFETQNGLVAENDIPQGFRRFASVTGARPGTLETRLVCENESGKAFWETSKSADKGRSECLRIRVSEDMIVNFRW
jgi:hypothetical protein